MSIDLANEITWKRAVNTGPLCLYLVGFFLLMHTCTCAEIHAKVLILGAGASGLQAARTFHDAGMHDFIIIEGANRIGGRVHSAEFAGVTVSLGALWAAPENGQTDQIVKLLDLDRHPSDYDSLTIRNETGHDVTDQADANYERFEKGIETLQEFRRRLTENDEIPDLSQRSALRIGGWYPQSAIDKAIEWFEYDFEYAKPPDVSSVRFATPALMESTTDFITDQRGFEKIFDEVAGFLNTTEYRAIHLNRTVVSIDYSDDLSVIVTCEDGTRYVGQNVLVTFSIGVLQRDLVQFIPPLPEWKEVAIQRAQMGAYTNIYISFPRKFWDDTEWILYASERRGYYPLFLNYQIQGLFPDGTPMMLVSITGEESLRVEAQPASKTKAEIEQVLRNMYGDGIPQATDILVSNWSQNRLTQGSYTHVPIGTDPTCRARLQSRVGRVFFGGEATSEKLEGYVAGGLETGQREANKILGCIQDFQFCPAFEGEGLACEKANSAAATLSFSLQNEELMAVFVVLHYLLFLLA